MTQPTEQDRADFEAWISKPPFEYSTAKFGNGEYVYATVGFARKAWQTAQAKMQARVAELEKDLKLSRAVVDDIFDDMECLPGCDSYGHETECPDVNPMAAFRKLRQERDELEAALQQQVAVADNANKLNSELCSRAFNLKQERDGLAEKCVNLKNSLIAASNYIDVLGGNSKKYRHEANQIEREGGV